MQRQWREREEDLIILLKLEPGKPSISSRSLSQPLLDVIALIPYQLKTRTVNRAKINYDQAKGDFDRYQSLFNSKIISPSEFQQYDIRMRSAREEVNTAQNNLDLIKDGVAKSSGKETNTLAD